MVIYGHWTDMNNSHTTSAAAASSSVKGRRQRRATETRLRLFRCALQLFAERGFANVTVEEITEAADVGKGTFFNYFESKDHVLGVMAEVQIGKVSEALASAGQGTRTIHAVLHALALRLAEEPGRSPALARAFISSFLASEAVRAVIERQMREGRRMIAAIIAAGQERGEIEAGIDREKAAVHFLQSCMGTVLLWSLDGEGKLKTRIEQSFHNFWRAVALTAQKQEP
jgi:AcrR family transcriptional regulator